MLSAKHHSAKTLVTWDPHAVVVPPTSNLTSRVEFSIIVAISFCSERSRTSLVRQ